MRLISASIASAAFCLPALTIPPLLLCARWLRCLGGFKEASELSPGVSLVCSSIELPFASRNDVNSIWAMCKGVKSPFSTALIRTHFETEVTWLTWPNTWVPAGIT